MAASPSQPADAAQVLASRAADGLGWGQGPCLAARSCLRQQATWGQHNNMSDVCRGLSVVT